MDSEPEPQPKRRRPWWKTWWKVLAALVLATVTYVLSMGPVYYLVFKWEDEIDMRVMIRVMDWAYRPLGLLPEKPMKKIITPYMRWWLKDVPGIQFDDDEAEAEPVPEAEIDDGEKATVPD